MTSILIILGVFVLYKFLVDFIIPVYRASKRVHAQFKNMQETRENAAEPLRTNHTNYRPPTRNSADYIDFEEVKD